MMRSLIFCLWLITTTAYADDLDLLLLTSPSQRAELQNRIMQSHLVLSPSQLPQIAELNLLYAEKAEPIIKSDRIYWFKLYGLRDLQQQKEHQLQQILTTDQFRLLLQKKDLFKQEFLNELQVQTSKSPNNP